VFALQLFWRLRGQPCATAALMTNVQGKGCAWRSAAHVGRFEAGRQLLNEGASICAVDRT